MKVRRALILAVALSLLVHLLVALFLHPPRAGAPAQVERVSIARRPVAVAERRMPTPPPPRLRRTPAPATPRRPVRKHGVPSTSKPASGGRGTATAVPTVSAAGTPAARPACDRPNAPAAIAASPPPPEIAPAVRAQGTSGVAIVSVQLDKQGNVTGTSVAQGTGNPSLDLVAVGMARSAQYSPALRDCKPVASTFAYSVKFVAW
jgi:TonB family protein